MIHHSTILTTTDTPISIHSNIFRLYPVTSLTMTELMPMIPHTQLQKSSTRNQTLIQVNNQQKFQIMQSQWNQQRLFQPLKHKQGVWTKD